MRARIALLAGALDLAFGEWPARLHPVVGMGRYLSAVRRRWHFVSPAAQLLEGGLWWGLGALGAWGAGLAAERLAARLPAVARPVAEALLLKPLFSVRALFSAVGEVERALLANDLPGARRLLSWHLVSRDTTELDQGEVAGAALESLAENVSDSVVAPLLAYRLGGLPLAALYRFGNTADAMWGYRTPELEWPGKVAARADDLLNVLPARLSGLLLVGAAFPYGGNGREAWRVMRRDARRPPSPNAGWPMAALAGALGTGLTKRGAYVLNGEGRAPQVADLGLGVRLTKLALLLGGALWLAGDRA